MHHRLNILNVPVTTTSYYDTLTKVQKAFQNNSKIYICVAAVHLVMEAQKNPKLLQGLQNADIVTPDGMPLVWLSKLYGKRKITRVYGPNLTKILCNYAAKKKKKVFIFGGAKNQSKKLKKILVDMFPNIQIVGTQDTPIRPIPEKENQKVIKKINASQADIVFVGMGCPNQELWIIENRNKLSATVLIGVGAAFDFITKQVQQAPTWMQNNGLEWLYRLLQEPQRLWKRYLILNTLFVIKISRQILRDKLLGKI